MKKPEIRRKIKEIKATVSHEEALVAAEEAFARLEECEEFQRAENVLVYHSLPDELSTHAFIARWHKRKNLFLPRVNGETLDILPYDAMQMHTGAFNIEEPTGDDIVDASEIDLIVVPGIAFDSKGNRVGRGKGYYDRLLCGASATKIGVGYDFQLVDGEIEAEGHDMKVDAVITNRRCVFIAKNKN